MFNNKKNERIVYFISSLDSLNGNMNNRELLIRKIINRLWRRELSRYKTRDKFQNNSKNYLI